VYEKYIYFIYLFNFSLYFIANEGIELNDIKYQSLYIVIKLILQHKLKRKRYKALVYIVISYCLIQFPIIIKNYYKIKLLLALASYDYGKLLNSFVQIMTTIGIIPQHYGIGELSTNISARTCNWRSCDSTITSVSITPK
jgi:hypothetical protein